MRSTILILNLLMAKTKKQTKTRVKKGKILLKINRKDRSRTYKMVLYVNGFYRCSHWGDNELSQWRIKDGSFYFRHEHAEEFSLDDSEDLIEAVKKAQFDLEFEKSVLCDE